MQDFFQILSAIGDVAAIVCAGMLVYIVLVVELDDEVGDAFAPEQPTVQTKGAGGGGRR